MKIYIIMLMLFWYLMIYVSKFTNIYTLSQLKKKWFHLVGNLDFKTQIIWKYNTIIDTT
jgi:hypothetical protein